MPKTLRFFTFVIVLANDSRSSPSPRKSTFVDHHDLAGIMVGRYFVDFGAGIEQVSP